MSDKKNTPKSVTLKRTVTIKAVVTEKFKQYMDFELTQSVKASDSRIQELDKRIQEMDKSSPLHGQLVSEHTQLAQSIKEFQKQQDYVKSIEMDSHFVQGTIDGFVNIAVGDKLYEKLGGMEILVFDGVVKSITPVTAPPVAAPPVTAPLNAVST